MEDIRVEHDVSEVSRTVLVLSPAGFANIGPTHGSEARVVEAATERSSVSGNLDLVDSAVLIRVSRRDRVLDNLVWRKDTKINFSDSSKRCDASTERRHGLFNGKLIPMLAKERGVVWNGKENETYGSKSIFDQLRRRRG